MRRPLFWVSVCLVILTAIRLRIGGFEEENPNCAVGGLWDGMALRVTGQVYQKDEESIYIRDVAVIAFDDATKSSSSTESDYSLESAAISQQNISNLICEWNMEDISLGSQVEIVGTFMPFLRAGNPGEFDAATYYRSVGVCGKIRNGQLLAKGETCWEIREWLFDFNSQLRERLYSALPQRYAAIMEAMLLGEQGNIDRDIKDLYRRNGILHILSISGMHVSIVGMSMNKALRKLGVPMQLAAIVGGAFLLAYGALTGFGLSAVRAIGMYLVRMLGEVVGRTYDMLTALGLVGCCMVLWNPYYLQNSGFLLSFSCVLGIGILYPVLLPEFRRYQGNNRRAVTLRQKLMERLRAAELPRRVGESFFLSLSVTLATLPVQLCLYYEVPVFSVFLNLLIVPLVEPLMMSGIVTMIIPKSVVLESVVCAIFDWYEFLCRCFDVLPMQTWNPGCPAGWQVWVYYGILFGVIWWRQRAREGFRTKDRQENAMLESVIQGCNIQGRELRESGTEQENGVEQKAGGRILQNVVCATLLGMAVCLLGIHPRYQSVATFLDVGQGSCVLLQLSSGENYLFDCGSTSRSNVGQYVLLPYLKYEGIQTLDGVFVSHPDEDHVNGILELLELRKDNDIVIRQLILPDVEESAKEEEFGELWKSDMENIRISYIATGATWECEGARFLCLHPSQNYSAEDANQYSQCIYVEILEKESQGAGVIATMLLTGDVGGEGEKDLIRGMEIYDKGNITVFQCAHHGSKYSNSEELLELLQPKLTVISAGRNNSYGHPHAETLERLEDVDSRVFSTVDCGMVQVELGDPVRVSWFLRE